MWFFLSLTLMSLAIKLTTITFLWKNKRSSLLYQLTVLLVFVSIIQASFELYSYTPLEEISAFICLTFLKLYYFFVLVFLFLLLLVTHLLIRSSINGYILISGIFFLGLLSTLLFFSDLIIKDYRLLDYSITRVPGQYYWLFQASALMSIALIVYWLINTIKSVSGYLIRAKCSNMLISFLPLGIFVIIIIVLMQLDFELNAIGFLPLFISIYLAMISWNLNAKIVPDFSFLLPGSPKQKLLYKMFRKICRLETEDEPINAEAYQTLLVKYAVEVSKGNQREAAKLLNTSPSTVSRMLRKGMKSKSNQEDS